MINTPRLLNYIFINNYIKTRGTKFFLIASYLAYKYASERYDILFLKNSKSFFRQL